MLDISRNLEVAVGVQFDVAIDFAALLRGGRGVDFVHIKSQSGVFFQRQIIAGGSRVVEVQRGVFSQINFAVAVAADTAGNVERTVFGHVDGAGVINVVGGFDAVHNFVIVFENSFAAKADSAGVPNRAAVGLFACSAHVVAAKGRRLDIVNRHFRSIINSAALGVGIIASTGGLREVIAEVTRKLCDTMLRIRT